MDRQEGDGRALAERLGWDVVAVFVDNDISPYDRRKVRPEYRSMLGAVRTGQVRGVVVWHPDRLHRWAAELEEFITVAEAHSLEIQTVQAGSYDLTSSSGRMVARMLGAAAQYEVDHSRERVQRAKEQAAASGKYRGGIRPFGFEKDGVTIRESAAQVIRDATKAVLAGRTLAALTRELNERGVQTSGRSDTWKYGALRVMLIRPRNADLLARGLPSKTGQSYEFEVLGPASWPAIVSEDEWRPRGARHRILAPLDAFQRDEVDRVGHLPVRSPDRGREQPGAPMRRHALGDPARWDLRAPVRASLPI